MTGIASATTLLSEARKVVAAAQQPVDPNVVASVIARHDWVTPLAKILRGLWTDAYLVGWVSSGGVLAHHGVATGIVKADLVKAEVRHITMGVDWGAWTPGDSDAAKVILGRADALGHLLKLVDTGAVVANSIVVSRMDRLAGILIDGIEKGHAPATIAGRLQTVLADRQWAHLVALTETTRASTSATLLRYGRNGVEAIEWATALDQRVCSRCQINEDQGAIPLGTTFPDGTDGPPGHPLCRCSLYPAWLTAAEARAQGVDVGLPLPLRGSAARGATETAAEGEMVASPTAGLGPTAAEIAADPAMKMKVADLKALASQNGIKLYGATRKHDIIAEIRQWEADKLKSGGKKLLPDGPIGKPISFKPQPIEAPPLGVPADGPVLSGASLNDWADYLKYDRQYKRFEFVDAHGNTPAEGVRVRNLRVSTYGDTYVVVDGTAWSFDGVAYLVEHRADQFGSPWVSRTLMDLRRAHEDIPAAKLANKSYAAVGGPSPADSYWRVKYNDPNHTAAASAGGGHTTLWNFRSPHSRVDVENILRHETGHNLDDLIGRTARGSQSQPWEAAAKLDVKASAKVRDLSNQAGHGGFGKVEPGRGFPEGVTAYGRSSAAEDFAESVELYQRGVIAQGRLTATGELGPVYFRDLYPARAKILDELFPDLAKAQKAEIKALRAPKPAVSTDLSRLKVTELRALAKERGFAGYSKLTKPQLLERLGKPVEVLAPEHDLVIAARERQAVIDHARARANLLTEAEHWLDAEGSFESMAVQLRRDAKRFGIEGHKDVAALFKAIDARDTTKIRKAIDAIAGRQKLTRIESSGDIVRFDRTKHTALGSGVRDGQHVAVVRPGYTFNRDGELIRLHKATVEAATRAEIREATGPIHVISEAEIERERLGIVSREVVQSVETSHVELVTFRDGSKLIRKALAPGFNGPSFIESEHDAEELATRVARVIGLRAPTVYRASTTVEYTEYVDAALGATVGRDAAAALAKTLDGQRMGLLDVLIENGDRHDANWFITRSGGLVPIDQGAAWKIRPNIFGFAEAAEAGPVTSAFDAHFIENAGWNAGEWRDNELSASYLRELRIRLQGLKSDFDYLHRTVEFNRMMTRLKLITKHAKGSLVL